MRSLFLLACLMACTPLFSQSKAYYVDATIGNDANDGSVNLPWRSVVPANSYNFEKGDVLQFAGGQTFGKLQLQADDSGLTIQSFNGVATLGGLYAYDVGDILVTDLNFKGTGTTGTAVDGIKFYMDSTSGGDLNNITFQNLFVSNFSGNGILVGAWATSDGFNNVKLLNSTLTGNGVDGFASYGYYDQVNNTHLYINNVKSYRNYGRTDITITRTGSGFTVGGFDGGLIENCEAYENGKNNRCASGGPQGFWCYNCKNLTFQYCTSHDNKAGRVYDGGGFDIDGGSQNCIIQYCYSYNNEGAGLAFYEHGSTNQFNYNIIRYNISENDARRNAYGAIQLWAKDTFNRIKNSEIYNNTIYLAPSPTASLTFPVGIYYQWTNFKSLRLYNNIIYTIDTVKILRGPTTTTTFSNNNYYTSGKTASFKTGGVSVDPMFKNPGGGKGGYVLNGASPMINTGTASPATQDIIGTPIPANGGYDIGAYESNLKPPVANAGPDQSATAPISSLTLTGIGTDSDGTIINTAWTKISGPAAVIDAPASASTTLSNLSEGYYVFRYTVMDNDSAIKWDDVQLTVYPGAPPAGSKQVKVNIYGGAYPYVNTAWNNWNVTTSLSTALNYDDATASGITAALSSSSALSDNGSTYGGTMAPPQVLRHTSSATVTRTLTLTGLSPDKTYKLEFYASRNNTGNSTTFIIGTTSVTVLTDKNKTNKAFFTTVVPDASGQVVVTIKKVNTYNYFNGFILTELNPAPLPLTKRRGDVTELPAIALSVNAYPNPSPDYFSLHISGGNGQAVQVRLVDAAGRVVEVIRNRASNTTLFVGHNYKPGVYYAEVMQDGKKVTVKLVK